MERQREHLKRVLQPLRQAMEAHYRSLEELERALIEFEEEALGGDEEETQRWQSGTSFELLSIPEVCHELGMGKSWVYKRIQSGEIPSVKLGRNIKVRREDLEGYLEAQRY
jgi:excisionase family DNA binding protein